MPDCLLHCTRHLAKLQPTSCNFVSLCCTPCIGMWPPRRLLRCPLQANFHRADRTPPVKVLALQGDYHSRDSDIFPMLEAYCQVSECLSVTCITAGPCLLHRISFRKFLIETSAF